MSRQDLPYASDRLGDRDDRHNCKNQLLAIAAKFRSPEQIIDIQPLGNGNINHTFLVSCAPPTLSFVLQSVNRRVFPEPRLVMQNLRVYVDHIGDRLRSQPLERDWQVPQILTTEDGKDYLETAEGEFWRSLSLIANAQTYDRLTNLTQAQEVGYALGMFHNLSSNLDADRLADTLEGFHVTPRYLQSYRQVLAHTQRDLQSHEVEFCNQIISDRQGLANILEDAKALGKLPMRTMHGDPKVNNILFDRSTELAVSVIDLDTVKAGLVHYDLGDLLRSGCNLAGEEAIAGQDVDFDLDFCRAILQGYLAVTRSFFTITDYEYIYDAIRVITFELGLRFFSDYLAGNIYFQVQDPDQNLRRSLVQFQLLQSIEAKEAAIKQIIKDCQV